MSRHALARSWRRAGESPGTPSTEVTAWADGLGIFLINVTGSFLLGVFVAASAGEDWPSSTRLLIAVGFLGSYTTFSTLTVASVQLAESGEIARAALNIVGSMAVGLVAAFAGILVGRAI